MNGLQTLPQWRGYFNSPSDSILGAINAVYPVGKLLGLFPSTWISDRYGRKRPMLAGFLLLLIGTLLQGAAQNVGMMIVSRFILGFGACG
jgi:MFS family permease